MGDHSFFPNNHEQVQNVKDPLLLMSLGQDGHPNLHWLHWWTREATIPLPHRCGKGGFLVILYLILIVKEREMDPFDQVQVSVLNKVGPLWLIHDYLCFWSIS